MIAKGRGIRVNGEAYQWRISRGRGRLLGTSGKAATFTAQKAKGGRLLVAHLVSKKWTEAHEESLDTAPRHQAAFTPQDAEIAIRAALGQGWVPLDGGPLFALQGVEFAEYKCAPIPSAGSLHHKAMQTTDEADRAPKDKAPDLYRKAAELEEWAVRAVGEVEPSRSVLLRSAASLYLNAGDRENATRAAREGLAGEAVPDALRKELQDVLGRCRQENNDDA